ncbi:hypothetical protein GGI23_001373 [Coemansia sp. RSA 2559]|nr:hypothetical protein GGI23_001373 [Coemansia sp. RSA 2559]KAJ2850257.1 hypothetical protein GGI22_005403 [Coemansia erecta]
MEETRSLILRAIVILGWMYARFEEYAARLQDEQRENQTFVDWALLAMDDLHWQNEGIHKSGNDDSADDGLRPIRPEIDYKLLLQFIRSAFRRRSADDAPDTQIETLNILSLKGDRNKADSDIVQTYFDILAERSNPGAIQGFKPKSSVSDKSNGVFEFPFHSSDLLDEATRRCARSHPRNMHNRHLDCAIPPPTCREALAAAKALTTQALAWPSAVLGNGLQWNAQSDFAYFSTAICAEGAGGDTDYDTTVSRISDMRCISNVTSDSVHGQRDGAGTVYLAAVSAGSQILEVLALPGLSSRSRGGEGEGEGEEGGIRGVSISLTVKTRNAERRRAEMDLLSLKPEVQASEKTRAVRVTGISFFDDSLLGITFTIDGCDSSYLGTISYRQDHGRIAYSPVPKHSLDSASGQEPGNVTSYPLEFAKLLRLGEESSRYHPVSLSTNGRPGRRSIAIVERRGKLWWPYDMDNSEDEGGD